MSNNISLNKVKNVAFLAKQSYETFESPKKDEDKKPNITNPATNSSFEVFAQTNEKSKILMFDADGFSGTVFKNTETNEYVIAFRGTELGNGKISA